MARLIVRLRGQQVGSVLLEESKTYVAGRKEDCDIILQAEKGISREHFSLSFANGVWVVELLSKYGVLSQHGAKVSKIELKHGELFAVPPYEFEYTHSKIYQENVRPSADTDEDVMGSDKTMVGIAPSVPFIRMVAKNEFGQESILQLQSGDVWIAGRDASCHILINDQRVSRRQFELRRSGQLFQIVDAGSANGTFVNGDRVRSDQAYVLKSGDEITVLDNRMIFELRDPHFQAKIEALPVIERSMVQISNDDESPQQDSEYQDEHQYDHQNQSEEHGSLPMAVGDHRLAAPYNNTGDGGLTPYHGQSPQQGFPAFPPSLGGKPKRSPVQKIMMLLVGLAAIFYIYTDFVQAPPAQMPVATSKANDPFSKLKPNQQAFVKQSYQMAKNLFTSGKYELARNELQKIFEIIPEYEDAKELDRLAKEAVALIEQERRQAELEKSRKEMEEKIQQQVVICRKQINGNSTSQSLENCLSSVIAFNPEHPLFGELRDKVNAIVADREKRERDKKEYLSLVAKMEALFQNAVSTEKKGSKDEAIEDYEKVISSKLPDPRGLKQKAKERIASIRSTRSAKASELINRANAAKQSGDLKNAILLMKQAKEADPTNIELDMQIDSMMNVIKKKMMEIYQLGILDESFGKVDEAIARWKVIIKEDVPDGEYYKKAYIKLKKYGAI